MKKMISILLVVFMMSGLLATAALADAGFDVTAAGNTKSVTAKITATGSVDFSSSYVSVTYDKQLLELSSVSSDTALNGVLVNSVSKAEDLSGFDSSKQGMYAYKDNGGQVLIAYAKGSDVSVAADGVVFTLKFNVKSGVTEDQLNATDIVAYVSMTDEDGTEVAESVEAVADGVTIQAYLLGDVNDDGNINARDALLTARLASKIINEDDLNAAAADVNGDGTVNARDALLIARFAAKIISEF